MKGIQGTTHPLDTPLILECIFKNLGVSDLKRCRQVNRVWHEAATKCMRPAVTVNFDRRLGSGSEIQIWRFLDLVRSELSTFERLPFASSYRLCDDCPQFWEFCGSSIKSLYLNQIHFDRADFLRFVIFKSCPNLENLVLDFIGIASRNNEEAPVEPLAWVPPPFPQNLNLKRIDFGGFTELGEISFLELFSYFPSLEELDGCFSSKDTSKIFRALATCREHDPQSWNIKKISFCLPSMEEPELDLRFLLDESLPLETLAVSGLRSPEHCSFLRNIFRANATTLKSLKVSGYEDEMNTFDLSPQTVLEKLVIFSVYQVHLKSISFLRYLPNLKKLRLSMCTLPLISELREEQLNHWIISSCTEFTLDLRESDERRWEENLLPLFRRIPNLEKLRVQHCTNKLFAGICEIFKNLVCLELDQSEVDDCGISGLDKEDVKRINEEASKGRDFRRPVTVPRPNLSSLKNLKWFSYKRLNYSLIRIKFCAAQCGVLQLPQLQHLKVEGCEERIWARLHEQFPWRDP